MLHTEDIGQEDKIKASVVAQLAKPAVEPSPWALLTKGFKYELLTWWGIIGGAITLFVAISTTLKLAEWASWLVQHWREWTHAFWVRAFGWLGIHVPPEWTPVLSFLLFGSLLTLGQGVNFYITIETRTIVDEYQGKSFQLISWRTFFCLVCTVIATHVWFYGVREVLGDVLRDASGQELREFYIIIAWLPSMLNHLVNELIFLAPLIVLVVAFARQKIHAIIATLLIILFWQIITDLALGVVD